MSKRNEEWRSIPDWPEYEASSEGQIRRVKQSSGTHLHRILRPIDKGNGYRVVSLWRNNNHTTAYVHRLVVLTFVGRPNGLEVNHKDGDKGNNHQNNLEYVTSKQNKAHAISSGLSPVGSRRSHAVLTEDIVAAVRNSPPTISQRALADKFGICQTQVSRIQRGLQWKHADGAIGSHRRTPRFSDQQVREIRALRGEVFQRDLATRFEVKQSVISAIQLGRLYK